MRGAATTSIRLQTAIENGWPCERKRQGKQSMWQRQPCSTDIHCKGGNQEGVGSLFSGLFISKGRHLKSAQRA